jgi:hypothetical protein
MLAIKINPNDVQPEEMSDAFGYFDRPDNALEWTSKFLLQDMESLYAKSFWTNMQRNITL